MSALLRWLVEGLTAIVAPPQCAGCDAPVRPRLAFCPPCAATLERIDGSDPTRIAAFAYGGALAVALRRFKFGDRPDLAPALAAGVLRALLRLPGLPLPDLVVPVPLHPARLVERGYNQAALLAREVTRGIGRPCAPRTLARSRATSRQTDLSRDGRARNVAGAFVVRRPSAVVARSVLIIDDVETTGATLAACRAALLEAGARSVATAVVARADMTAGPATTGDAADGERHTARAPAL